MTTGEETTDVPLAGTVAAPRARACASSRDDSGIQTCGGSVPLVGSPSAVASSADARGMIENAQPSSSFRRRAMVATSGAISGAATIRTGAQAGATSHIRTPTTVRPASSAPAISATSNRRCRGTGCQAAC